jgi:hypothetical protein
MGGQFLTVVPEFSLVVTGLVDTSAPDVRPVTRTETKNYSDC